MDILPIVLVAISGCVLLILGSSIRKEYRGCGTISLLIVGVGIVLAILDIMGVVDFFGT